MKKVVFLVFILALFIVSLFSYKVEIGNKIILKHNEIQPILIPGSFVVNDKIIYLIDRKAGDIKIFDEKGNFMKSFWQKGLGPNEFVSPHKSTIYNSQIVIVDYRGHSLYLFKIGTDKELELLHKRLFHPLATDFNLVNSNYVWMSGSGIKVNGDIAEYYGIFKFDIQNSKFEYVIPAHICYGFKTNKQYENALISTWSNLGMETNLCVTQDAVFFVHTSNLNVLKFNKKSKSISFFGKKTKNYIKPYVSPELIKASARFDRNNSYREEIRKKMSFVLDIFALDNQKIGLVYSKYRKQDDTIDLFMQFYKTNGDFIYEKVFANVKVFGRDELFFYYGKEENKLYILETITDRDFDQTHIITKYNIIK